MERIRTGVYAPGSPLPPVRALGVELRASPSTVSRALQGLERRGWVNVIERRGASVTLTVPPGDAPDERTLDALRGLAARWRLYGRTAEDFRALVEQVLEEAFRPRPPVVFVECNPADLAAVGAQIRRSVEIQVEPLLLADLRPNAKRTKGMIILTSFFHFAEVRSILGPSARVVPLNLVLAEKTMRVLSDLPGDVSVVAVGHDERTTKQIVGLASHYALAPVVGTSLTDPERSAALVEAADVVVVTNATELPQDVAARARRLVVVEFELESGGLASVRAALHSVDIVPVR